MATVVLVKAASTKAKSALVKRAKAAITVLVKR
jgi:hypothetical protein